MMVEEGLDRIGFLLEIPQLGESKWWRAVSSGYFSGGFSS